MQRPSRAAGNVSTTVRLAIVTLLVLGAANARAQADTTPPAVPTGLTASASNSGIGLDWDDNTEADLAGYNVARATDPAGPWTVLTPALLTASSFYDSASQPGVNSYYRVWAVDNSGNASAAAETSATRLFTAIRWSRVAPAPLKRMEAFGAAVNGKLYLLGGYRDTTWTPTARADVYYPATNTWSRVADLPIGLSHAGVAVDGPDIYLAGGYTTGRDGTGQTFSTRAVWKYNTTSNTYSSMPQLPAARGAGALARVGRVLHFFGGSDANRRDAATHWTFNIDTGTSWTTRAPMPLARNHLGGVALDGKVYAVAGQSGQDAAATYRNNVDAYDSSTNIWTAVTSMPQVRSHHNASTFVMGGRIIVVGGESAHSGAQLANVTAYNPATNTWTEMNAMPVKRTAGLADEVNGVIYQTTGSLTATTFKGVPLAQ